MTMTIENTEAPDNSGLPASGAATETNLPDAAGSTAAPAQTAPVDDNAPKSMLEAIEAAVPGASSEGAKPEVAAVDKPPVDPNAPPKDDAAEDITKMPEGLSKGAQERFQRLANDNKEVKQRLEEVQSAVEPFRQALQENGVRQEQFEMATGYIGLINKGDYRGALAIMDKERQQLALMIGEPLEGVDALSDHPDLREAVDSFQITEPHALELARQRSQQQMQQQRQQEQQQTQQFHLQQQQATQQGTQAVDAFCKQMMKSDLDYAKVEAILLPQIQSGLLKDVPPSRWAAVVESTYKMIKASAGAGKQTPSTPPLRGNGLDSPGNAPKTMHEAMWGGT